MHVHPSVGEVYARIARTHGFEVDSRTVQTRFDAAWGAMRLRVPRGSNRYRLFPGGEAGWWREVVSLSFEGSGFDPAPHFEEFFDTFADAGAWETFPDAVPVLQELTARGVRLGVISNWDSRLPALLEGMGLRRYFSTVLYSAAEDVEKPSAEIFRRAAQRCGVDPERALHVGDRLEEDYRGARAAGLRALLVARRGESGGNGAEVVTDLGQVSGHL